MVVGGDHWLVLVAVVVGSDCGSCSGGGSSNGSGARDGGGCSGAVVEL